MDQRICGKCKQSYPLTDFYRNKSHHSGREGTCKYCKVKSVDAWRVANRDRFNTNRRVKELQKKYGLTGEEYDALAELQGHVCAGCGDDGRSYRLSRGQEPSDRPLVVDHCHTTLRVRGLLCSHCNLTLGNVRDNPQTLRNLADYLERRA